MTAVAIAALALALAAMSGLITFAVMNSRARDQREEARVSVAELGGELRVANDKLESVERTLKIEQERSDALDDELAKSYSEPDPVSARDRVLQKWKADHDYARGRAVQVSAPPAAAVPGPDGLLRPGD